MQSKGFFGCQRRRRHVRLEAAVPDRGHVALPDVQRLIRLVAGQLATLPRRPCRATSALILPSEKPHARANADRKTKLGRRQPGPAAT